MPTPDTDQNTPPILVIGVGNVSRGDDAVGLVVVRHLRQVWAEGVGIVERQGEATDLIETWQDTDAVILIDAVQAGEAPGTIFRLDPQVTPIPRRMFACSTHAFGVAEALALAQALQRLPQHVVVYGVQGKCFAMGEGLSDDVAQAVPEVVRRIQSDITVWQRGW